MIRDVIAVTLDHRDTAAGLRTFAGASRLWPVRLGHGLAFARADEDVRRMLAVLTIRRPAPKAYPAGTLGARVEEIREAGGGDLLERAPWIPSLWSRRLLLVHDYLHALTGFGLGLRGEALLAAFILASCGTSLTDLGTVILSRCAPAHGEARPSVADLAWAWRAGRRHRHVMLMPLEFFAGLDLGVARRAVGLPEEGIAW